jgi:hypothetical protein
MHPASRPSSLHRLRPCRRAPQRIPDTPLIASPRPRDRARQPGPAAGLRHGERGGVPRTDVVCVGPRGARDFRGEGARIAPPQGTRLHQQGQNAGERPPAGGLDAGESSIPDGEAASRRPLSDAPPLCGASSLGAGRPRRLARGESSLPNGEAASRRPLSDAPPLCGASSLGAGRPRRPGLSSIPGKSLTHLRPTPTTSVRGTPDRALTDGGAWAAGCQRPDVSRPAMRVNQDKMPRLWRARALLDRAA